jgi:PAS domain S-box-containing protein
MERSRPTQGSRTVAKRSVLRGVVAGPRNTSVSGSKTRPHTSDDVNGLSREVIEALPAAVYKTDAEGRITFYNEAAVELWGCRPDLGDSKFCGSWKLYWPDGAPLPHDECPMAMALKQKKPVRGMEAVAERPDGTRVPFIPYPTPLFDASGKLTGAVNMLVDISERKRAEEVLAAREAQLAAFVEHAPAAIAMFDRDMRYLAVSRRFIADYQLPPVTQLLGRSHYEIFSNVPQRWRDIHARVLAGEECSHDEDLLTRENGRIDCVRWFMAPWREAKGSIGGALLFAEVKTEQVKARRALAESEARFRAAFENAAVGVVLVDPKGSLLRVNDTFARMLGYSAKELETKAFQDVTHPEDLASNLSVLDATQAGETSSYCIEKRYVRKDGGIVWASLTAGCVRGNDGAVDYLLSVIEDITDRKLAEARLAERNIQLTLAAKSGLVGTYAYDADTEIMHISAGYAAIHGFPEGTTEIARSECLAGLHPDDIERVEQLRSDAFRECRHEYNAEYRIVRPGGEMRWVETRCFLSFRPEGYPERVVGVSIDVTERKQVEEQQRTLLAELDHRVKNSLSTVSAVVSHTQEGSRSVATFAAALKGRIRSMATTHELLSAGRWQGISLAELVRRELAPYVTRNNTEINGPNILLKPEAGQAMAMVLHELATNAAKYGALSTKSGRVSIRWDRQLNGRPQSHLTFEWKEIGGPPVAVLGQSGYGTSTIRDLIPYEFGGTVDLVFAPEGVRYYLELPADWLGKSPGLFSDERASSP